MVETFETLPGRLVAAAGRVVVDVVVARTALARAARHERVTVVVLSAPVTARP